ncbi:hypothetical protein [Desulfuromonas thiophila]|uniref:hypothetical protein n=1 Tax=Desulfuromonas thiophila TaxID=57664 RepID=UPI001C0B49F2|nr:hypothetical protein [Desulfuromonas thiophila]
MGSCRLNWPSVLSTILIALDDRALVLENYRWRLAVMFIDLDSSSPSTTVMAMR